MKTRLIHIEPGFETLSESDRRRDPRPAIIERNSGQAHFLSRVAKADFRGETLRLTTESGEVCEGSWINKTKLLTASWPATKRRIN